jgi:hypothetical protein
MGYLLAFVSCHSCGSWNQSNKLLLCGFSPQRVLCFQENINETLASPYSGAPSSIPPSFFWINSMHQYTSPSFSPPLEVVLDNSTLDSTQPEILAFICISLSLSEQRALMPRTWPRGLSDPWVLCDFGYSESLFLFFNCGLFSNYKSSSFSQGGKRKEMFPFLFSRVSRVSLAL